MLKIPILSPIAADAIFNLTPLYKTLNCKFGDLTWHLLNYTLPLEIIASPNSKNKIRQICGALESNARLLQNVTNCVIDTGLTNAIHSSKIENQKRNLQRIMFTGKRSAGIYCDINEFLRVILSNSKSLSPISSNPIFNSNRITTKQLPFFDSITTSKLQIDIQTYKDFLKNDPYFYKFVKEVDFSSIQIDSIQIPSFDAILHNGNEVTVNLFTPPHLNYRNYQINSYKFLSKILFFHRKSQRSLKYFIDRFTFNFPKEEINRLLIQKYIRNAPQPLYTTKHILVTEKEPESTEFISEQNVKDFIQLMADLYFNHGILIPQMSESNLRSEQLVFHHYASLCHFDTMREIKPLSLFTAAQATQDPELLDQSRIIYGHNFANSREKHFISHNAKEYWCVKEAFCSLSEIIRKTRCEKDVLKPISDGIAKFVERPELEEPIRDYLYHQATEMVD